MKYLPTFRRLLVPALLLGALAFTSCKCDDPKPSNQKTTSTANE